jgi:UDP-N-acetylmuramoylalanine--D-glutamate ligase
VLNNYLPISKNVIDNLLNFGTIEHRFENFLNKNGIRFINDSKSTNVGATIAALNNLANPIILIFGGQSKKQNFKLINNHLTMVKVIIIIGDEQKKIKDEIDGNMKILVSKSLNHAIKISVRYSRDQDIVLFSPGCASKDWFKNFEDRGEQFKKIVTEMYEKN